jgi:hypothetical protein
MNIFVGNRLKTCGLKFSDILLIGHVEGIKTKNIYLQKMLSPILGTDRIIFKTYYMVSRTAVAQAVRFIVKDASRSFAEVTPNKKRGLL